MFDWEGALADAAGADGVDWSGVGGAVVDSVRAETGVLWREEERRSRLVLREPEGLFLEAAEGIVRSLAA